MFKTVYRDLTQLSREKILAKYGMPVAIGILICSIIGQLIIMCIPLGLLNKADGRISDVRVKAISIRRPTGSSPIYPLVITLDNSHIYNIQDTDAKVKLSGLLKSGDQVTIYYPTPVINFLGAGFLKGVSQIEKDDKVLYSWKDQQTKAWFPVCIFIAMLFLSWYLKLYWGNYGEK